MVKEFLAYRSHKTKTVRETYGGHKKTKDFRDRRTVHNQWKNVFIKFQSQQNKRFWSKEALSPSAIRKKNDKSSIRSWFGEGLFSGQNSAYLLMRASKSNTKHTVKTTCSIFCLSGFKSTLLMKEGLFSKIPFQHTKQEELISDASSEFMVSDLNQIDCSLWLILESRIYSKRHSIFGVHGNKSLIEE